MKLAIMQPYFFPYVGYFSLIKHTDEFILFDTVQFIRHGWIERNRILKQTGGWQYIQVPLIKDNGRNTLIKDIRIKNSENWKQKVLSQLQHYKKRAPHYYSVVKLLNTIFEEDFNDITHLNKHALSAICSYLGIERQFPIFSEMELNIGDINAPDEWALNICKAIGADSYQNPIGGLEFFNRAKYENAGIEISFQNMKISEYDQHQECFEPGLSILDVLMFNSAEETNSMLDNFELI